MNAWLLAAAILAGGEWDASNVPAPAPPPASHGLPYTVRWDSLSDAQQREYPTMYLAHLRGEVLGHALVWVYVDSAGNLCTRHGYGDTPGYPF